MYRGNLLQALLLCVTLLSTLSSLAWNTPTLNTPSNGATTWTGVGLDWFSVFGSQNYEVQLDTSPNFDSPVLQTKIENYINSSSSNNDTYEYFENLYFGTVYYWRVRAWVPNDTSAWSVSRTFTTRDDVTLNTPNNGSTTWTGVGFDWFSHVGVDLYQLQVDTSANFDSPGLINDWNNYINSSSSNNDTYTYLEDLYFGATYHWRVRVINAVDTSEWSVVRTIQTRDDVNLSSPSNNASTWAAVGFDWSTHVGVSQYHLQVDTSPSFDSPILINDWNPYINSSSSNNDTYTYIEDLYFGTTYYWRVRATNANDTSGWSEVRSLTTRDDVNLNAPSNNATTWSAVGFDWFTHLGVSTYQLQVDTSGSFDSPILINDWNPYINSSSSNNDTYTYIEDLLFGTTYHWRVRAINEVDTSGWSEVRTLNTRDDVDLSSPSNNATTWTGVGLDWNTHLGVSTYQLQVDTSDQFDSPVLINDWNPYINSSSSNNDTYTFITGLLFGERHYWRVRAINVNDTSGWSEVRAFDTRDFVTLVSPADMQTNISTGGVGLNWNSHHGLTFYQVQFDTTNVYDSPVLYNLFEGYVNTSSNNWDTYQHTGGLFGQTVYFWRVRGINANDTSAWTQRIFSTGVPIDAPAIPSLLSPADGDTGVVNPVVFDWTDATNANKYVIQYSTNQNFINASSDTVTVSNYTANNVVVNSVYYWRVRAANGGYYSDWSPVYSFTNKSCYNTFSNITTNACLFYEMPSGDSVFTSGTYTDTLINVAGCDSIITLNVTIIGTSLDTSSVTACDSYDWNGTVYTNSGFFIDTFISSLGCDSAVVLNLTINASSVNNVNVTACDSLSVNGSFVYVSGIYADTFTNVLGCDSVVNYNVTINPSTSSNLSISSCDSYTSPSGNHVWTSSGSYTDTLINAAGCDSVISIQLTILSSTSSSTTIASCDSYVWNGTTYSTSGTYSQMFVNAAGCDSTAQLNLTIHPSYSITETISACDSYLWNGTTYTTSGTYVLNTTTVNGCDSLHTLQLTILESDTSSESVTACESYTWNGTTYASSGTYTDTLVNAAGCDSIATLQLTILQADSTTISATACDSYTWNGNTYSASGTYTQVFVNAAGCDSTVQLNLTIHPSYSITETISACDSYVWNANTYTTSGTYAINTTTVNGCDSVHTLQLTILESDTSSETVTTCESYTWNGTTYASSGTYTDTLVNAAGCDSIATLQLTILQADSTTISATACESYTWNGNTYTVSGNYSSTFQNAVGCDSTVTLNLTINYGSSFSFSTTACDSYTFNNQTFTSSGVYAFNYTDQNGCDSTITLNLTINTSNTSTENVTACDSYTWNGNTYTQSGSYTANLINSNGCDSTATLNLTILSSSSSTTAVNACGSYTWNGNTYTMSGSYDLSFTNSVGCDSTATLNLVILNSTSSTTIITACDSFTWNGTTFNASGVYADTFVNSVGCDSVALLDLTIHQTNGSYLNIQACDAFTWNGATYTQTGMYTDTFQNALGCDSIAMLDLVVHYSTDSTVVMVACDSFSWNAAVYSASGIYVDTFTNALGCDSLVYLDLTIHSTTSSESIFSGCDAFEWNGTLYTSSGTYVDTFTNANGCDSIATLQLTLLFSTSDTLVIDTCDAFTSPSGQFTWTESGTYFDTLSNTSGCDSILVIELHIPVVDTSVQPSAFDLTATAQEASFQWFNCDASEWQPIAGETEAVFAPEANGSYGVEVTQFGCTARSACFSFLTVGLADGTTELDWRVYPNPARDVLMIQADAPWLGSQIRIYTALGQLIHQSTSNEALEQTIHLSTARGLHFIEIWNPEGDALLHREKLIVGY